MSEPVSKELARAMAEIHRQISSGEIYKPTAGDPLCVCVDKIFETWKRFHQSDDYTKTAKRCEPAKKDLLSQRGRVEGPGHQIFTIEKTINKDITTLNEAYLKASAAIGPVAGKSHDYQAMSLLDVIKALIDYVTPTIGSEPKDKEYAKHGKEVKLEGLAQRISDGSCLNAKAYKPRHRVFVIANRQSKASEWAHKQNFGKSFIHLTSLKQIDDYKDGLYVVLDSTLSLPKKYLEILGHLVDRGFTRIHTKTLQPLPVAERVEEDRLDVDGKIVFIFAPSEAHAKAWADKNGYSNWIAHFCYDGIEKNYRDQYYAILSGTYLQPKDVELVNLMESKGFQLIPEAPES